MPKVTFSPFKPVFSVPVGKNMSMTPGGHLVIHPAAPTPVKPAVPKPASRQTALPYHPIYIPPARETRATTERPPTPAEMRDRPETWGEAITGGVGATLMVLIVLVFMFNLLGPFMLKGGPGR